MTQLTEAAIRPYVTGKSLRRGQRYYHRGAVLSVARRGDQLVAEVQGSQYEPYRVRITLDEAGIVDAHCSCPYDWGGYCKHIVAAYLTAVHEPEQVDQRPTMEALLEDLDAVQLREILLSLTERRSGLTDIVEAQVLALHPSSEETSQSRKRPSVDPEPFRRQVRYAVHSLDHMRPSEAYWHVGGAVDEVRQVLDQAWDYIEAGDGNSALVILEAITDEYMEGWLYLDDSDGEASGFFRDLGEAWTEAILTADLTPRGREEWAERLDRWQDEVGDYGIDTTFSAAAEAARQGWDYPPLQRVLEGEITRQGAWEGEVPWYADDLAVARLNVLERQQRYEDYLNLALAEGQTERYLTMLAQLGRIDEAVEYGLSYLATAGQALALAKALREQDAIDEALRIAEHGLNLEGYNKARLASWLRDVATGVGRSDLALKAAVVAFRASPSLADYQAVEALAGEQWPERREGLLAHLRQRESYSPHAQVDVFLHEGLVEDAIAAVEGHMHSYDLLERVVDAALETRTRPDWVIRTCRYQAERIIEPGKSAHYHHALHWLTVAREAYQIAGRQDEWREYLDDLLTRHYRKYKLRPMLEGLLTS